MFDHALIERAAHLRICITAEATADRRHRIERIVEERIRRLFTRCFERECAVAIGAIGFAAAVEIVAAVLGPRWRPLLFFAPLIDAHHEELYWRVAIDAVIDALQPVIEES